VIEGVTGKPGAGKSLYAAHRLLQAVADGRNCYSNLYPRWAETWRYVSWESMKGGGDGLFVIDEAQVWFPSRGYEGNTSELTHWQQSRKRGADLLWIAQHENRIDKALRELTSHIWEPRLYFKRWGVAVARTLEGERVGTELFSVRRVMSSYFTDQVIGTRDDSRAVLAKVTVPWVIDEPLYVQEPTHAWTEKGLVPFELGMTAEAFLYQDYERSWYLLGDNWKVEKRVASPAAGWVRAMRSIMHDKGFANRDAFE